MAQVVFGMDHSAAAALEVAVLSAVVFGARDPQKLVIMGVSWYIYNAYVLPIIARKTGPVSQ